MGKFFDILAAVVHVAWYALVGVAAMIVIFELIVHHVKVCG
jgi:hypothetical protein